MCERRFLMLTILSSRQNKRETVLQIGYTYNKEEAKLFSSCLRKNFKMNKGGRYGVQKGSKKTK